MNRSAVAQNYAETLYELASRSKEEPLFADLIAQLSALYRDQETFRRFLDTPKVTLDEKREAFRRALSDRVPEAFLRFLLVVVEKRRQRWLPEIDQAYRDLLDERAGRVHATVRLSFEPDETPRDELVGTLSEKLGVEVVLHFVVDARILGGVVVRVGDRVLDGSIRRRLDDLRIVLRRTEEGVSAA